MKNEAEMALHVAAHLKKTSAREIRVGGCKFDVVAYDKKRRLFEIAECKLGSKPTVIGHAFGQAAAYCGTLSAHGVEFLDAYMKEVKLKFTRMMEATNQGKEFRVAFYVALEQKACLQVELIRSIKRLIPKIGIIRVKDDGRCRRFFRISGKKDLDLCKAEPVTVKAATGQTGEINTARTYPHSR